MKILELKALLKEADREHLEKAFAECYKQLCKSQKQEIDSVIVDILNGKTVDKKKVENAVSFEMLEQQITVFIENAYAQNYLAPNRIIPKNQRPKWRFLVKNFIKELEKVPVESENHSKAVKLLTDLYALICAACNSYLFSTDDAFRSIGWEQPKLFELLVKKTFSEGYSREKIAQLILYAVTGGLSRESLHVEQETVLLGGLKTSDVKLIAIEESKKLVEEREEKLKEMSRYDHQRYYLENDVNELCSMILLVFIALGEAEEGIRYYFKHSQEQDQEITLYRVLQLINWMEAEDWWIKAYEYGISKKIKPRESLRIEYEKRKAD